MAKKFLSVLVLVSFLAVLVIPTMVSANEIPTECEIVRDTGIADCPDSGTVEYAKCYEDGVEVTCPAGVSGGICCLAHTIVTITDWIFVIMVAIAVLFVIIGAITILTAGGSPEKVTSGRNYIMYAMIGIVIGLLAKAIPAIVRAILV